MPGKLLSFVPVIALLLILTACDSTNPEPPNGGQPTVEVRDDLSLLRTRITLPDTVTGAKWTVLPLGTPATDVPAPTDTILYAYLTASDDQPLSFGAQPRQGAPQQSITLPTNVAEAIIPANDLTNVVKKPGTYQMHGIAYDPSYFELGSYRGVFAIKLANGMLVALQGQ